MPRGNVPERRDDVITLACSTTRNGWGSHPKLWVLSFVKDILALTNPS